MFKSLIFLLMVICCNLTVSENALSQMSPERIKAMREGMARARAKEAGETAKEGSDKRSEGSASKTNPEMKKDMKEMKETSEGSSLKPFDVKPKTLMAVLDSDGDGQLSGKEIDFATDQLLRLDANDNGQIDVDELPGAMAAAEDKKSMPSGFDPAYKGPGEHVYKTMAGFDANADGVLTRSEMRAEYKGAFRSIDTDGNREIDPKELLEFSSKQ